MLQRIQTLWMLLAVIFAALTLKFPFYSGNKVIGNNGHLFQTFTATDGILILILTVVIIAGGLINIFNYKNRSRQLLLVILLIVLSLVNIFLYYHASQNFIEGNYSVTAIFALLVPVFLIFSIKGIMKDNKLVKSADRLR